MSETNQSKSQVQLHLVFERLNGDLVQLIQINGTHKCLILSPRQHRNHETSEESTFVHADCKDASIYFDLHEQERALRKNNDGSRMIHESSVKEE